MTHLFQDQLTAWIRNDDLPMTDTHPKLLKGRVIEMGAKNHYEACKAERPDSYSQQYPPVASPGSDISINYLRSSLENLLVLATENKASI